MSSFSDLDMLYDYEKDVSAAALGYMTMATRAEDDSLVNRYFKLAEEAGKLQKNIKGLIEKFGGIS